ncbi:uncharacterized protein LOC131230368 [Magnolia sinica]|uniref:uncharacterized protein LOC131230368 n=1 Tax=Magnolia sinica TaxID=86752 RepID=UPI00265B1EB2|nr:uncharacterized protein LOC131230368 [Magnolia sinica]
MDFFRSVFSDDPEPSDQDPPKGTPAETQKDPSDQNPNPDSPSRSNAGAWSFGSLIKTLATSSESVIETYRRDLEEFRSGLKKETAVIRDVIKDLPVSLEASASAAQDSIESVGQVIDEFGASVWRGTAEIVSQGKDAFLPSDQESDYSSDAQNVSGSGLNSIRYSRFEAQLLAIQSDLSTYCEEPDDLDAFRLWKSGLVLEEKVEEIENLCGENGVLEGVYTKLVPDTIDNETFWSRYFYKVYKLKQVEDARVDLVKRAISREDEEDLSWDVDDDSKDEEGDNVASELKVENSKNIELEKKEFVAGSELVIEKPPVLTEMEVGSSDGGVSDMGIVLGPASDKGPVELNNDENFEKSDGKAEGKVGQGESNNDEKMEKSDEKTEVKVDQGESSKDNDFSIVSSQPLANDEDDLGWDEIEDLGSSDENKGGAGETLSRVDLRKRLSAAEEDEDLSWDIEDDDEPSKQ